MPRLSSIPMKKCDYCGGEHREGLRCPHDDDDKLEGYAELMHECRQDQPSPQVTCTQPEE